MHIVITGGAGFLGARLARELLARGALALAGAPRQAIATLTLVDRAPPPAELLADARVRAVTGELGALLTPSAQGCAAVPAGTDAVVHLAAAVSGECEADFDLGMRSNLQATWQLLEACRASGTRPLVVFASSLAVFGQAPGLPLPEVITDTTLPTPQSSYGTQKFIGEQLVADFHRKGFIRGRNVRLMTVSVRPGRPNGAASSFLSGMIREPLAGVRARVPVPPELAVALASPARTMEGLLCALQASDDAWGSPVAFNLPALRIRVGEMAEALARAAGPQVAALLDWTVDPTIARVVGSWPSRMASERAQALGLQPDADFDGIVRDYMRENPDAVRAGRAVA